MDKNNLRIVFMGTPEFAATCLKKLCDNGFNVVLAVAQPDKPVGRKHVITPPPSKVAATELGIEVYQPDSMRTDEAYERILEAKPDLIITAAYGKILPERMLNIPKYECINVHASLLPKYRGSAPVQYSILNGDPVTGVTIMKMDVGMDTGDMLTKVEVPIDINVHTDALMEQLAVSGSDLLINTIEDYVDGKITPVKQNEAEVSLCPPIKPEQGIFSWDKSAFEIHNTVRALSTWPGAQTVFNGKKFKIYDTLIISSEDSEDSWNDSAYVPGTVVKAHKGDLIVKCGQDFLKLMEVQAEGGKRLKASDCAHNYKPGMIFGV